MNEVVFKTLKEKDFIVKNYLLKVAADLKLTLNDTLLLIYFMNQEEPTLNIDNITSTMYISEKDVLESFTKLQKLNLITIEIKKLNNGVRQEIISLDNIIKYVTSDITETHRKTQKNNLFEIFESEFGRPLSPMEFEVINDWDKQGYSEELITAALREAVECNAKNFKYINSILLAWRDKGYKTPNDIIRKSRHESEESNKELFDYNWLDEE